MSELSSKNYKKMDKWIIAQEHEPEHWSKNIDSLSTKEYRSHIESRAKLLEARLQPYLNVNDNNCKILEIGSGATPLVDFYGAGTRISLDPLADFYKENFKYLNESSVEYVNAMAEELKYDDNYFDLVICRNVIDHVADVDLVLSEMKRVIKPNGIVFIGINVFAGPLLAFRTVFKDPEHPYTFSQKSVKRLLLKYFKVESLIKNDPFHMKTFTKMEDDVLWKNIVRGFFFNIQSYHFLEFFCKIDN